MRSFYDALYGSISLDPDIADLARAPLLQRLRDVRLSNIDSIDMPGISGITRFEHSLGVAYVASRLAFAHAIPRTEFLALQAAALIHDAAIAPFGHLLEEAFEYVSIPFNHEDKWQRIAAHESEVGGLDLQVYRGREAGLRNWASRTFHVQAGQKLNDILSSIRGGPPFGSIIAGGFDVDNLDNVVRIACHMGMNVDRSLPTKVAAQIAMVSADRITLTDAGVELAQAWLRLRSEVYTRLMLSEGDFVGKVMLLYAFSTALDAGVLQPQDWTMTDRQVIEALQNCARQNIRDTIDRWLLGEVWSCSRLMWFRGPAPSFRDVRIFANELSDKKTQFFAYRIKDKRHRQLLVRSASGSELVLGQSSDLWLLGVATPRREALSANQNRDFARLAATRFDSEFVSFADERGDTVARTLFADAQQATFH